MFLIETGAQVGDRAAKREITVQVASGYGGQFARPPETMLSIVTRRFLQQRLAVMGMSVVLVLVLLTILGPLVVRRDPLYIDVRVRFTPPGQQGFILGSDELGRDLLSRLLYAGRISLLVGFTTATIVMAVGSIVGAVSGYYGGRIDNVLMRLTDLLLSFPTTFLLLILAAYVGSTPFSIAFVIGLTSWMDVGRIVRANVLSLKEQDFITAARCIGASNAHIIFRNVIPNAVPPVIVAATLSVARSILTESYLSFLGFGIQPPTASWGNMLNNAQENFTLAPWVAIFPGLAITITVVAFNVMGDGLRDALDPRVSEQARK
jgi:peptide/nickel transport system permease protein